MAGLFYAYACSVNPGLGRLPDTGYLAAMQSINRAILNPFFLLVFMGALIILPLGTWRLFSPPATTSFYLIRRPLSVLATKTFDDRPVTGVVGKDRFAATWAW